MGVEQTEPPPPAPLPPHVSSQQIGVLSFEAQFDSGNCARIEQTGKDVISLWTAPDAAGLSLIHI